MIAEIIPETYDASGTQVSQPFQRRRGFHPTFPMGRYVSQPLHIKCQTMADVRNFLSGCKYVSDQEQFGKRDYWQPPEEFEKRRKGDCEDFALWTWRQLLNMGYEARFVGGAFSYGDGHAWVEYFQDGKCFLLEPLWAKTGYTIPRLMTLRYQPRISVAWDGQTLRYFSHKKPSRELPWLSVAVLLPDYFVFQAWLWFCSIPRLPGFAWSMLRKKVLNRKLWGMPKGRAH